MGADVDDQLVRDVITTKLSTLQEEVKGFKPQVNLTVRLFLLGKLVSQLGIEPRTRRLRVCCSAN